ncbi:MAG: hypothetical protein NTV44_05330 [Firmicutes bacterium]|nr:hypothetical protein [Bacillota bacterium]
MEKKTDKTKKKTWKSIVSNVIFWSVVGFLAFYLGMVSFFPAQSMDLFGFSTFVVTTDSMVPVIKVNEFIVVVNTPHDELQVGDIITFYADVNLDGKDEVVTHYLATIGTTDTGSTYYKTHAYGKNDISERDFWTLTDADIIGQYAYSIPVLGYVISFIRSPYGIATIGVNIVVIGLIYYVISDKNKKKKGPDAPDTSTVTKT